MKTIARLLVILALCGLIGAGIYWFVQSNPALMGAGGLRPGHAGGEGFSAERTFPSENGFPAGSRPALEGRGEFRGEAHREGASLSPVAFLGILKNLAKIALITVLVWGAQKLFSSVSRRVVKTAQ